MTNDEIKAHDHIWGYMYGQPRGKSWTDVLIRINVSQLYFHEDGERFVYYWGYPGPDMNIYNCKDYGKTWCFYRKEMPDVPVHELDEELVEEELDEGGDNNG